MLRLTVICIDKTGHVSNVRLLRSTRVASYDQKLVRTVAQWVYAPHVEDGEPLAVCTGLTFIYTQNQV